MAGPVDPRDGAYLSSRMQREYWLRFGHDYEPSAPWPDDTGCAKCGRAYYHHRDYRPDHNPSKPPMTA